MSRPDAVRGLRRVGLAVLLAAGAAVATAPAAGAHTTSGPPASDYSTQLSRGTPAVRGVTVTLADDGERIELRVTGSATVVVTGYAGEPYLRIGRAGTFENRSSPAVALNRARVPSGHSRSGPIPPPHWVRISARPVARWHDHRTHWMGGTTPAAVRHDPDRAHTIARWKIPIRVDGRPAGITGTISWSPPPAAWPWWLVAFAVLGVIVAAGRVVARTTALVAVAALTVAEALHLWGAWPFSTASTGGRIGENLPSIAAIAVCLLAAGWVARRSVWSAAPLLIGAGLFSLVAGGLADLAILSHSWIPSRLDPTVARFLVAVALGVGGGVVVIGASHLRAPRPTADRLSA